MTIPETIAIDGPAASGKSTLGKRLADAFGYLFFDTGVMYRAITLVAGQKELDLRDEAGVSALAENTEIDVQNPSREDGRNCDILADGQDVTWQIRRPEVEANVSLVSSYQGVRQALTEQQRRIGLRGRVVMVGRDIGTVVLPEAQVKIYLDASAEERARRRCLELTLRGEPACYEEILAAMRERDRFDSTRQIAPLRPAEDAIILNSDGMDADQVFENTKIIVETRLSADHITDERS
ncbi:MAG: (d)CMP kinase [Anaerolineales bacterium]|nr:(d)CMP kinase [Anaerolineales bacterium]